MDKKVIEHLPSKNLLHRNDSKFYKTVCMLPAPRSRFQGAKHLSGPAVEKLPSQEKGRTRQGPETEI